MKWIERGISVLLVLTMLISALPAQAMAAVWEDARNSAAESAPEAAPVVIEDLVTHLQQEAVPAAGTAYETSLSGVVVDENGAGVPEVRVSIFDFSEGNYLYADLKTNGSGRWSIDTAWVGDSYLVSYYKTGYDFSQNHIRVTATAEGGLLDAVTALPLEIPGLECNAEDYTYTTDDIAQTATITGYTGTATVIQLPETLGGYPVTDIAKSAF